MEGEVTATQPLVTVIVPIYNVEPYLPLCLDSIVAQTHTRLEVLLVDDGSTDGSAAIANDYAARDSRMHVVHQPNAGLSAARNIGLRLATGQYITMVDSDDCIAPTFVQTLLETLVRHQADIAVAAWTRFEETPPAFQRSRGEVEVYTSDEAINDVFYQRRITNSACSRLFKASLFNNLRFPEGMLYEDLAVVYPLLRRANRVAFHPDVAYFYRRRASSILGLFTPERVHVLDILERLEVQVSAEAPQFLPAVRSRCLSAYFNIYLLCCDKPEYAPVARRCWQGICRLRRSCLLDSQIRLKNRAGILMSLPGQWSVRLAKRILN